MLNKIQTVQVFATDDFEEARERQGWGGKGGAGAEVAGSLEETGI